jgi:hexosaminidase
MILPRMSALSEVVWTPKENKDWKDFKFRLNKMKDRYEAMELNYAEHVFETKTDTK